MPCPSPITWNKPTLPDPDAIASLCDVGDPLLGLVVYQIDPYGTDTVSPTDSIQLNHNLALATGLNPKLAIVDAIPSGGDTDVQYNKLGYFGGDGNFTWNYIAQMLTVVGNATASGVFEGLDTLGLSATAQFVNYNNYGFQIYAIMNEIGSDSLVMGAGNFNTSFDGTGYSTDLISSGGAGGQIGTINSAVVDGLGTNYPGAPVGAVFGGTAQLVISGALTNGIVLLGTPFFAVQAYSGGIYAPRSSSNLSGGLYVNITDGNPTIGMDEYSGRFQFQTADGSATFTLLFVNGLLCGYSSP
jgi:hypothetical protein